MKMVESPGTWRGVVMRLSQCVFATAPLRDMAAALAFSDNIVFRFMSTTMLLQIMWSLALACVDIYAMRNKKCLHKRGLLILLIVGDYIMVFLTLAAVHTSAAAATAVLGDGEHFCPRHTKVVCGQVTCSIHRAFMVFSIEATSAFSMLALLA